jgi:hypothetical protein
MQLVYVVLVYLQLIAPNVVYTQDQINQISQINQPQIQMVQNNPQEMQQAQNEWVQAGDQVVILPIGVVVDEGAD